MAGWFGNDLVTLSVALPLLVGALVLSMKGSHRAQLVWFGILDYMLYNYAFYAVILETPVNLGIADLENPICAPCHCRTRANGSQGTRIRCLVASELFQVFWQVASFGLTRQVVAQPARD
ncbi:MAG TPA: hypothetical protein GX506_04605 [Firmicutes bacterium]|nr:hypothetical protein [Bacillota bacterium]